MTRPARRRRTRPAGRTRGRARAGSALVPDHTQRHALSDRLLALPNVVGVYVGHKRAGGSATGEYALVCAVSRKRKVSASAAIPPELPFQLTSRARGTIRTDVVEVRPLRRASQAVCGPGDRVVGTSSGTIGIALAHPTYGPVVTSAGHVFTARGWTGTRTFDEDRPTVSLGNVPGGAAETDGELLKVVVTPEADYALVRPRLTFPARNVYRDERPLGAPYQPSPEEVGTPLQVLAAGGVRETVLRGVHGRMRVGAEGLMEELIVTDACTVGGDSGGALVDGFGRVWGLLVGFADPLSVFMSPFVPMRLEGATYR